MNKKSKKVYVVTDGSYSDYHIVGVFINIKDANKIKKIFNSDNDIEKYTLNQLTKDYYVDSNEIKEINKIVSSNLFPFKVAINKNGDSVVYGNNIKDYFIHKQKYTVNWIPITEKSLDFNEFCYRYHEVNEGFKEIGGDGFLILVNCLAKNEKHAVKIANETRTMVIANNYWGINVKNFVELFMLDNKKMLEYIEKKEAEKKEDKEDEEEDDEQTSEEEASSETSSGTDE